MDKREVLETVTRRLLEKEVMEGDELRQILEGKIVVGEVIAKDESAAAAPAAPGPSTR